MPDRSVIAADNSYAPAQRVWLDNSQPPQLLPPATSFARLVQPLDDGYLIVSFGRNRVERTGSIAWKRTDLMGPTTAVVVGHTVLVTENDADRVSRLDLRTGKTINTFGDGALKNPCGIAVGPTGEILVTGGFAESAMVSVSCLFPLFLVV